MGKVIKKDDLGLGDISPDTGFAEPVSRSSAPIISRDAAEARSEAQTIRERASREAQELRERTAAEVQALRQKAAEEAEKMKADAYQKGFEEGKQAGAAQLAELVARASQRFQQIEAQAEPQLRDLALKIARKILGRELEFNPESVIDIVKQALSEKARQRREIFLRVNPEDMQLIRDNKADLLEVLSRAKEIGIREDPEVERYGVVIETDAGTIDAQLETQLAAFERVFKEVAS